MPTPLDPEKKFTQYKGGAKWKTNSKLRPFLFFGTSNEQADFLCYSR